MYYGQDKTKAFHPFGLAITSDEQEDDFEFLFRAIKLACESCSINYEPTILIADSAAAITNGFQRAYNGIDKVINQLD